MHSSALEMLDVLIDGKSYIRCFSTKGISFTLLQLLEDESAVQLFLSHIRFVACDLGVPPVTEAANVVIILGETESPDGGMEHCKISCTMKIVGVPAEDPEAYAGMSHGPYVVSWMNRPQKYTSR